jgi:hypothetical protein
MKRRVAMLCGVVALGSLAIGVQADEMTPAQMAAAQVKAETAQRLITFGRQMKDPNMLLSAVRLIGEVGAVADPAQGMKGSKPVKYDVDAILGEAGQMGADKATIDKVKASMPTTQNECTLFYNCTSDYSVCWWDHWC